jgi:HAD superfamily hydrolase (TIGR01450 family)
MSRRGTASADVPGLTAERLAIADGPETLRDRLAGVRGLVLDADGVIVRRSEMLPGVSETLATLAARGTPFRIVTNFSTAHRSTLAARFGGGTIPADWFITAASAAAGLARDRHPDGDLLVIASPDALREFEGQRLLTPQEADSRPRDVAAVVIGDAGDDLRFEALDVAFRCLLAGADFLAMHRNLWWTTGKGATLDSGALVVGLEAATGRRAVVAGKPSPVVFRQAVGAIARDLGGRVARRDVAMVGDDIDSDIHAAKRVGLRGVLVLTGKHAGAEVEASARRRGGTRPDAIAPSLVEVVAALD